MSRVGLHMIVRNEAHVIERCLASVRPLLDWWVVCDTGSTDGTQDVIRRALAGLPGRVVDRPWVSFGHNRQEALVAARELPASRPDDHTLWIDADEELVDVPAAWPELTAPGYLLRMRYDESRYQRLALVRLGLPWRWTGAIHEYLELPPEWAGAADAELAHLDAPQVLVHHEGARSLDPDTLRRDAAVLEAELARDPGNPRLEYFLAQTWSDAGQPALALTLFRRRMANAAGWDQERWLAGLQAARCLQRLAAPPREVTGAFLDAFAGRPTRAEPLVELAAYERQQGRFEVALLYARAAAALPDPPREDLLVDVSANTWRAQDEIALSCWPTGRYAEGQAAAEAALALRPDEPRLVDNLRWYTERADPDRPDTDG